MSRRRLFAADRRRTVTRGLSLVAAALAALLSLQAGGAFASQRRPSHGARIQLPPLRLTAAAGALVARPADCVPTANAPPYQLGLVAQITNGVLTAGPLGVGNLAADTCGVVTVSGTSGCPATGVVTIPADGQIFPSDLRAVLGLVPGQPLSVPFRVLPQTIAASFSCVGGSSNGLAISVNASVEGTTSVFGVTCAVGPFVIPLTGTVTSINSFSNINGHLTSLPFSVPGATISPTCPQPVAANLDELAGLPTPVGLAHLGFDIHTALYQPGTTPP